jgi:TonB family protein
LKLKTSFLLIALCFAGCCVACAENVKDALNQNYKKHILTLRTPFTQNSLKFDAAGQPVNPRPGGPWLTYGGMYVEKLDLSKQTVRLDGHRVGFSAEKKDGQPLLVPLGKSVRIEIELDRPLQSADEARAVLDRVFYLDGDSTEHARPELRRAGETGEPIARGGGGKDALRAIYAPEPEFSEPARKKKIQGTVGMTVVVDKAGNVARIRLDKALGYGLDETAMAGVTRWRFTPPTRNDQPAAVAIYIEVDFHLY